MPGGISQPFTLGTVASDGGESYPAIVLEEFAFSIPEILRKAGDLGLPLMPTMIDILDKWEVCWPFLAAAARALAAHHSTGEPLSSLRILAPVRPRQIICAGANYRQHVVELMISHEAATIPGSSLEDRRQEAERIMDHRSKYGQPYAFVKPYSSILDPFANLVVPSDSVELDWELELGVVIGRPARRVPRSNALDHVAGYVIVNDVSARDHISRPDFPSLGLDYIAGKGGPGFFPIGPYILPSAFVPDPQKLMLTLKLNGDVMQHESTQDMIFPVAQLVEFLSVHMQLLPGDVISTGSPSGNGAHFKRFLRPGDVMESSIDGLGVQRNLCVAETLLPDAVLHRPFTALETTDDR